jgi:hypothetical protein
MTNAATSSAPMSSLPGEWDLASLVVECLEGGAARAEDGRGHAQSPVEFIRLFPFTDDDGPIAMIGGRGGELALIPRLAAVPPAARDAIQATLLRREFLTTVEQVLSATSGGVPTEWSLRTDRGPITIRIRDEDAFRSLPRGELLITDDSGARYLIRSVDQLDAASRAIVRRFA